MSEAEKERRTVRVGCRIPGGLMLKLYDRPEGYQMVGMQQVGAGVRLNGPSVGKNAGIGNPAPGDLEPGITTVDAEFMDRWMQQHENDPLRTTDQVFLLQEESENP